MFCTIVKSDDNKLESDQNQIASSNFNFKYVGAFIINKYFQTNETLDVLLIFELLMFQHIHNFYASDACVCFLAVIYLYFSCISVIVSNYNIKRLCLIKQLIYLILQLSLPKKLIEPIRPRTSYLKKSEKVRVVYPLSK